MNNNHSLPDYVTVVERQTTTQEDACYVAYHPELPTCLGQGSTPEEAAQDLGEATALALEYLADQGLPIPQPRILGMAGQAQPTGAFYSIQTTISAPSAAARNLSAEAI